MSAGTTDAVAWEAVQRGRAALRDDDVVLARRWLDRARRLAPGDGMVALLLATIMLRQRDPDAVALFQEVTRTAEVREAWYGLAAAHQLNGASPAAAAALAQGLSRHALGGAANRFVSFDAAADEAQAPGWCGVQSTGHLAIRLIRSHVLNGLDISLDGRPIRTRWGAPDDGGVIRLRLPQGWQSAAKVTVECAGQKLLGSPIALQQILRVEGFVGGDDGFQGGLTGWAWSPHDPDTDPVITISAVSGGPAITLTAQDTAVAVPPWHRLARPRGFHVPAARLARFDGMLRILGRDGRHLYGSPHDPGSWRRSAMAVAGMVAELFPASPRSRARRAPAAPSSITMPPITMPAMPAAITGSLPRGLGGRPRTVDIVIPVYGGRDLTLACLDAVIASRPDWVRIVVVDDASPDATLALALDQLARRSLIRLVRHPVNRGFPAAVNTGMRESQAHDVVLLNSDTLVPQGWLERLRNAAYRERDIGTVTPLSNDATILSYPSTEHANALPDAAQTGRLDALAQIANADMAVDIPTAIGFCTYIKRDCLTTTGLFREDAFAQGYGEENDFCIRARHLGWRHVAAPDIFVAHVGGQSFGSGRHDLIARNLVTLNQLHPGYAALIEQFQRADPMAEPRRRLDIERWKSLRTGAKSVLLITHGRRGGVQRRVAERAVALRAEGLRPIVIWPVANRRSGRDCVLGDGPEGGTPNLRFAVPDELDQLAALLAGDRPVRAEVHHLIGHDHALMELCARLRIPYDVVIHDYSWFCPRITLTAALGRYCGEPAEAGCIACVADNGGTIEEAIAVPDLVRRSTAELAGASQVITPSADVASRIRRHFPALRPVVQAWERDEDLPPRSRPVSREDARCRVCVIGAIGIEKGYEILLACARDAAERRLALEFVLVGHSHDDARLLDTGRVFVTGAYEEHEIPDLVRTQQADHAFLPSTWPETWSYTLTHAWRAGLDVLAFDLGAPADRIRRTGRGWLVPLGLPAPALNNRMLELHFRREQPSEPATTVQVPAVPRPPTRPRPPAEQHR